MNIPPPAQNIQMPEAIQNISNSLNQAVGQVKSGFNETVSEFGNQVSAGTAATQGFLQSNTIIAKFAFVLLIIILFIFLFSLGIKLINYFTSPPSNPYVIYGMVDGNSNQIISTDPTKSNSVVIARSNNQTTGLEFTWSVWLSVNDIPKSTDTKQFQHIFNKGDSTFTPNGITKVNNAPGVYLSLEPTILPGGGSQGNGAPQGQLVIVMDTVTDNGTAAASGTTTNAITIPNIPLGTNKNKKWFHLAIRIQNTILDVYINGVVAKRTILTAAPKQNYNDVNVCQNGGFTGKLSNLQYFPYALNAFDINRLVYTGPNTMTFDYSDKNTSYLSSYWYTSNYN